jgi:uncharacterized spore protein YtfJ
MIPIGKVETTTSVGKTLRIGGRTIYLVIQTSTLHKEGKIIFGIWISPIAAVVVERTRKYVIPLTDNAVTLGHLLETTPALKERMATISKRSAKPKKKTASR